LACSCLSLIEGFCKGGTRGENLTGIIVEIDRTKCEAVLIEKDAIRLIRISGADCPHTFAVQN
jgi:hypothetical protein